MNLPSQIDNNRGKLYIYRYTNYLFQVIRLLMDTKARMSKKRRIIEIRGIVQGVGFRPCVYKYARSLGVTGFVANTARGVIIEAEGTDRVLDSFIEEIRQRPPVLAEIHSIEQTPAPPKGSGSFSIESSIDADSKTTLISPDIGICHECRKELFTESDRRFRYPFINCTNCGPRYTIIKQVPYDRVHTTMSPFVMCEQCSQEYRNPEDRRFHAQPDCCPVCGPHVRLTDPGGAEIQCTDPIVKAAELLNTGNIVAVKGLGGFHMACDASDNTAVKRLRQRKSRYEKPLAVMVRSVEQGRELAAISDEEAALMESGRKPVVLVRKKPGSTLSPEIAPQNSCLGLLLPYTPLHCLLMQECGALVMTSGNISEEPIVTDNTEALKKLGRVADYFLVHNRDIYTACDDSVTRISRGKPKPVRRSRGYVPTPVILTHIPSEPVLATGPELKNTVCITRGDHAFLSQHIGDLKNLETFDFFTATVARLGNILDVSPRVIAHDMHPEYLSTKWARSQPQARLVPVQHHHAHIAACLAENQEHGKVIGLAMDGTGYGTDGAVWGGEILIADCSSFSRAGHIRYRPMPGGDAAVRQIWRMAVSYMAPLFGDAETGLRTEGFFRAWRSLPVSGRISDEEVSNVLMMIERNVNTTLTSSLGRLFDGVAALCGIRDRVSFDGQAAIALEALIMGAGAGLEPYAFHVDCKNGICIDPDPVIESCIRDIQKGTALSDISYKFHMAVVTALADSCTLLRERTGLGTAALSGGCFQNAFLHDRLAGLLEKRGFLVLTHSMVPVNDGGVSLGQAAVAAAAGRM